MVNLAEETVRNRESLEDREREVAALTRQVDSIDRFLNKLDSLGKPDADLFTVELLVTDQ